MGDMPMSILDSPCAKLKAKGRHRLYVGKPGLNFEPRSPDDVPNELRDAGNFRPRCTLAQGRLIQRQFNSEQLQVPADDRRWLVLVFGPRKRKRGTP